MKRFPPHSMDTPGIEVTDGDSLLSDMKPDTISPRQRMAACKQEAADADVDGD